MKGQQVSHYCVYEQLGEGGNGVVYRAEDVVLGRPVALKFLPAEYSTYAGIARFQHEARTASSLNHPNICTIHEIGEHQGRHFLAMELLDGAVLSRLINGRPIETYRFIELSMQMADALDAAHSAGIAHRDVKPANIFVTLQDRVKLLDFGLAVLVPRQAPPGAAPAAPWSAATGGTIPYMSPEQVRGEAVDHRTDLFALGTVLYEMATGQRPFVGATPEEVLEAIQNRLHVPVREINPALPAEIERIIDKALEKNPKLRFQSASDVHTDLRRLKRDLDSVTTLHTRTRTPSRPDQPASRRRFGIAITAGAALGIAGIVAIVVARSGRREPAPVNAIVPAANGDLQLPSNVHAPEAPQAQRTVAPSVPTPIEVRGQAPAIDAPQRPPAGRTAQSDSVAAATNDHPPPAPRSLVADDLRIAREKIQLKLYDQAVDTLRRVIAEAPRSSDAVEAAFLIGSVHTARGATDEAMSAYLEIAHRYPDDVRAPEALVRLAESMLTTKQRKMESEARRTFSEAAARYPASAWAPVALLQRGELEERLNLYQRDDVLATSVPSALVTYRELVDKYASSSVAATALFKLARIYVQTKRYDLAAASFEDLALRDGDNKFDGWFAAGELFERRLRDSARAKSAFARVPPSSSRYSEAQKKLKR